MEDEVPKDLCAYRRSASQPEKRPVEIMLKSHEVSLKLDIAAMGVTLKERRRRDSHDSKSNDLSLAKVLEAHATFKAKLQPDLVERKVKLEVGPGLDEESRRRLTPPACQTDLAEGSGFRKRCTSDVNTISLFFPDLASSTIHNIFSAWLAYICAVDDIIEAMGPADARDALICSIETVRGHGSAKSPDDQRIPDLTKVLYEHIAGMPDFEASQVFLAEVAHVLRAHYDELDFLEDKSEDLERYLDIRRRTISLTPFFAVLKGVLPPGVLDYKPEMWTKLQNAVCLACGLQNDLIGIEKDLEKGDQMNAVIVLLRSRSGNVQDLDETLFRECVHDIVRRHNTSVESALACYESLTSGTGGHRTIEAARKIILLVETHMRWCASAKRYRVTAEQRYDTNGGERGKELLTGIGFNGEVLPLTPSASQESPEARSTPRKRKRDDDEVSVLARKALVPANTHVVRSEGIIHGLPTYAYNPELRNLTAIVTGATGVSGYHMVKILASSSRWRKIYCLSSRPPPEHFFADLGRGAAKVEHMAVDFLGEPAAIAEKLKERVERVDHIFYFSYTHPTPHDNPLNFWADPDGLNKANLSLFTNFLEGLKQTNLKPKRFILQTGTKHYAFYLGPAAQPAFESDPRVTLDQNFYYAQEDALAKFCVDATLASFDPATMSLTNKMTWAVARPNYIAGAVRDGTLNHLLGISIYAAVQARLGQRLDFPGDYRAWDREQVQSTGLLNAFFEEWLALSEMKNGEAFNIHDGQNFSWGRLWPCIAKWFGINWSPPETDLDKYRTFTMPGKTPRGYGPQVTMNSTFSLLEWSQKPEVENAWKDLAAENDLVLDPFSDQYRARIFSFADSAIIGDGPMTTSLRKARQHGFFGTVDSFHAIFDTFHDMARLKLTVAPTAKVFEE